MVEVIIEDWARHHTPRTAAELAAVRKLYEEHTMANHNNHGHEYVGRHRKPEEPHGRFHRLLWGSPPPPPNTTTKDK